jgi:germination protein M
VVEQRVATAAMQELIAGPRGSLQRLVPATTTILAINRSGDTITVNLDTPPGSDLALQSIALTLSEFDGVDFVEIQVNGQPVTTSSGSIPMRRPILNSDNPQGLPTGYESGTRFLPLYFLKGGYAVRITRLVPRTNEIARATVEELLAGPGSSSSQLSSPIPAGTELRGIRKEGSNAIVDLTESFATASDRRAALNMLLLSLTELRDTQGARIFERVEVLVESERLEEYWGSGFAGPFARPLLNPET